METPRSGDKLFNSKEGLDLDYASINRLKGLNNEHSFFLIIEGYRDAALEALNNLRQDKEIDWLKIDSKIFPIIFLFRHYLEIILKDTIRYFNLINKEVESDEVGFQAGHSLKKLWDDLRPMLEEKYLSFDMVLKNQCIEDNNAVESMIIEIDEFDKGSFGFRYPFNATKNINDKISHTLPEMTIDLNKLNENMNKLITFFEGINWEAAALLNETQSI